MPRPNRPKKPPIGETPKEINNNSFLFLSSFLSPSSLSKRGKKREHP